MSPALYIFGIVAATAFLVLVIELLRRRRLRERHAIWWLVAGLLALIIGAFPGVLVWGAGLLGVEVPVNLVFFVSIALLFIVSVQYASELTKLEGRLRILAERATLLELRVHDLEQASDANRDANNAG